jgi:hypothetical protein
VTITGIFNFMRSLRRFSLLVRFCKTFSVPAGFAQRDTRAAVTIRFQLNCKVENTQGSAEIAPRLENETVLKASSQSPQKAANQL